MTTPTTGARACPKCGDELPPAAFARHAERGHQWWCRACMTQARREWRERIRNQPVRYDLQRLRDRVRKRAEYLKKRQQQKQQRTDG